MKEERQNGKESAHEIKDETKREMLEYLKKKQGVRDGFSFVQIIVQIIVTVVYCCCLFPVSIFFLAVLVIESNRTVTRS